MNESSASRAGEPQQPRRLLSRRRLLIGLTSGLTLCALGGALGWTSIRKWLLARNIEGHFSYLHHNREGVYRFIEFFEEKVYNMGRNPLTLMGKLPENLYLSYLASSNYFTEGEDESKEVNFVALWYPMRNVCVNPFSKRLLPDGAENPY